MPARAHRFYLEEFYIRDAFAKGRFVARGTPITLSDIKGPVYHVATKEDHIAPAASVYRGAKEMTNADVRFVLSGSGHIAGVVNPPAMQKYQSWTNPDMSEPTLEEWLKGAEETPGSWWPDWDAWLSKRSGRMVPARSPGRGSGRSSRRRAPTSRCASTRPERLTGGVGLGVTRRTCGRGAGARPGTGHSRQLSGRVWRSSDRVSRLNLTAATSVRLRPEAAAGSSPATATSWPPALPMPPAATTSAVVPRVPALCFAAAISLSSCPRPPPASARRRR